MSHKADVLIVTVTEVEIHAVSEVFRNATGRRAQHELIANEVYLDLGEINGSRVYMALSGMGSGGVGGSQERIRIAIAALSPGAVIMVGIAFGINDQKQAIGDVLLSERLMLYDLQRRGTGPGGKLHIIPRGDRPSSTPRLVNWLRIAGLNWSEARVRTGLVLSGEHLVDNVDYRAELLALEEEAIGGEMEGAGLYVACQNGKVDWVLVKAICDWADGRKEVDRESRQKKAAHNAAAFVLHALRQASLKQVANETAPARMSERKSVPSSIPAQPHFFGRERELAVIHEAIAPEARTWGALIDGPGGIGKTALAIRAGHLAPDAYFDRKIFLSAKVRELTPAGEQKLEDFMLPNYISLLTELGRELGVEDIGKTDPNVRANEVRRGLAGVRALIIVDNVETFEEPERVRLYQFLSRLPSSCKAIVTSRRRADIDARVVRLDRLEKADALDLVQELAKNNRLLQKTTNEERASLYEITNGNPLLIKWAAGQLGRPGSQCHTMADVRAFLASAPRTGGNDPLEYIFGDLLDTFSESETAVLSALTHFTQPATVQWIADVAGIQEPAALTALEDLTDRALLVSDQEARVFFLPPLAATFLRRKRPEAISKAGDRFTDRVHALVLANGYSKYERFSTLEAEWPAIEAALPLFVQGENGRLQTLCSALRHFLEFSGRWDERLSLHRQAEERAVAAGDFYFAGWRAYDAGWISFLRSQPDEVLACVARSAAHWEKAPRAGIHEKAAVARLRGDAHKSRKDFPAAVEAVREALGLWRAIAPEGLSVARTLNSLAGVERLQGDYTAAERDYREALRIHRALDDREGIAMVTGNLAALALDCRMWPSAEAQAREALALSEKLGRKELIGYDSQALAKALARQGKRGEGLPHALRAVEIFLQLRQPGNLAQARAALKECGG
ncbi:MAG TPA: tetratricopeptide repeat protein [Thermoanaerobaculia bacterium]|nr:tetratricopeptide repeat protein [Thermoanaerobaculia bacterium]